MSRLYLCIRILAALGITLALYLLWEQATAAPSICSVSSTVNCDAIISGAVSKTLGIPTPLYGLFGYSAILFATFFDLKKTLLGIASFGFLFCMWIGYRELFDLHVICPICILCDIVMTTIFVLSIALNSGSLRHGAPAN